MATMETSLDSESISLIGTTEIVYLASRARAAQIVWGVLTACCLLIGALPYMTALDALPTIEPQTLSTLILSFNVFAGVMTISSLFIRYYLLAPARLLRLAGGRCAENEDPTCTLQQFAQLWMVFSVMLWGINESIASFGLAQALATREPNRVLPFAFIALILNLAARPELRDLAIAAGVYQPAEASTLREVEA